MKTRLSCCIHKRIERLTILAPAARRMQWPVWYRGMLAVWVALVWSMNGQRFNDGVMLGNVTDPGPHGMNVDRKNETTNNALGQTKPKPRPNGLGPMLMLMLMLMGRLCRYVSARHSICNRNELVRRFWLLAMFPGSCGSTLFQHLLKLKYCNYNCSVRDNILVQQLPWYKILITKLFSIS